jgi:hypothetical protein
MGYHYLASPYSHKDPLVREERYLQNVRAYRYLFETEQVVLYSPIIHFHELAKLIELPKGWEYWRVVNEVMLRSSGGLIILQLPGWEDSIGLMCERELAQKMDKPIRYL